MSGIYLTEVCQIFNIKCSVYLRLEDVNELSYGQYAMDELSQLCGEEAVEFWREESVHSGRTHYFGRCEDHPFSGWDERHRSKFKKVTVEDVAVAEIMES